MMRYESFLPLIFRHRLDSRIVRQHQNGHDVLVCLETVLKGLDKPGWEDWTGRIELVELCLSDMQKAQGHRSDHHQSTENLERAILNLRAMLVALKQRDRVMARQMGRAARSAISRYAADGE